MTDFYLNAGKMAVHSHGLQWSKLKGLLQDKLVESETHRRTAAVRGKFLPLSVWAKKGYDEEAILARAEKQKSNLLLDYLLLDRSIFLMIFVLNEFVFSTQVIFQSFN